jgi:hypothetical protein
MFSVVGQMKFCFALIFFFSFISAIATAEEMTFKIVSDGGNRYDCCWVVASGEITANTPEDFAAFVREEGPKGGPIRIVGSGSDIPAAMELGTLIRNGNFSTIVGSSANYSGPWYEELDEGECTAGCAIAFFGGNQRLVPVGTELKLTQFQADLASVGTAGQTLSGDEAIKSRIENQIRTGEVVNYLVKMGIDLRAYTVAASVNPITESSGRSLPRDLLLDYSIDNASDQPSDWFAEPLGNWFRARTETAVSGRAITLNCSRRYGHIFGFEAGQQTILNIQGAIQGKSGIIEFSAGGSQFKAQTIGFDFSNGELARVEFSIEARAAQSIIAAESFFFSGVDGGVMRTEFDALAISFAIQGLQQENHLPSRLLELCFE